MKSTDVAFTSDEEIVMEYSDSTGAYSHLSITLMDGLFEF